MLLNLRFDTRKVSADENGKHQRKQTTQPSVVNNPMNFNNCDSTSGSDASYTTQLNVSRAVRATVTGRRRYLSNNRDFHAVTVPVEHTTNNNKVPRKAQQGNEMVREGNNGN